VAVTRCTCDIRIVAKEPADSDAQVRLEATVDRAIREGPRRRKRPLSIRLPVERIVRATKPGATDH
jgi:hypothetical protein